MSPEQAIGRRVELDHRTDLFSLGVTLYELLTHRRPFEGETTQAVLGRILTRKPADPRKTNPWLAPDLVAVVMKALEKAPPNRYQSAAEMAADLRAFLGYRPVRARRWTHGLRLRRWVRREPLKAALGAMLLLAVSVSGYAWMQRAAASVGHETMLRDRVEALLLRWTRLSADGWYDEAERVVDEARRLAPDDALAVGVATLHHLRLGEDHTARKPEGALAVLDAHTELAAREPGLRRIRAIALDALGRADEAQRIRAALGEPADSLDHYVTYHRALARNAVLHSERARALYHASLGPIAGTFGAPELELDSARATRALWPDSEMGWINIALHWQDHDPDKARHAAGQALRINPKQFWPWLILGQLEEQAGDLVTALEHYRKAHECHPGNQHTRRNLAYALQANGLHERALEMFRSTLELDADDLGSRLEVGNELLALDRPREALAAFDAVAAAHPDIPDSDRGRAKALDALDEVEAAAAAYHKSIEKKPTAAEGHAGLAELRLRRGPREAALEPARRAVELGERKSPEYLGVLAGALEAAGDRDAAAAAAREGLALLETAPQPPAELRELLEAILRRCTGDK